MKKILTLIVAIVVAWGCNEEELINVTDPSQTAYQDAINTADDLALLVNGTYQGLWEEGHVYDRWANLHMTIDARTDDAIITGNGIGFNNMGSLTAYTNNASDGLTESNWLGHYTVVLRANEVLRLAESMEHPSLTDDLKDQFMGQAYFLRGFAYHRLSMFFGDNIPVRTEKVTTFDEVEMAPASDGEVLSRIESDLNMAADLLPESWTGNDKGRVTKGAAVGILGKAYFQRRMYPEALTQFEKIINGEVGDYGLVDDFRDNHTEENEFNKESIFEINMEPNGSQAGRWMAYSQSAGIARWFNIQATDEVLSVFQNENQGDPRYHMTFYAPDGAYRVDGSDTIDYAYDLVNESRTSGIITIRKWDNEVANQSLSRDGVNYRVLRYADVLLSAAECALETGDEPKAKNYISEVRQRANNTVDEQSQLYFSQDYTGAMPAGYPIETDIDAWMADQGWDLQQVIINERRMELSFEQSRYWDLIRWDEAGWIDIEDYITEPAFNRDKLLFPIPQNELAANAMMEPNSAN